VKTIGFNQPLYILPIDHRASVLEMQRRFEEFVNIFEKARP
jgi:hypothetical protein